MTELTQQVTAIAINYLGPAGNVFLQRQAKMHLEGLAFADLERKHLPNLQYWVRISAGLLIDKTRKERKNSLSRSASCRLTIDF